MATDTPENEAEANADEGTQGAAPQPSADGAPEPSPPGNDVAPAEAKADETPNAPAEEAKTAEPPDASVEPKEPTEEQAADTSAAAPADAAEPSEAAAPSAPEEPPAPAALPPHIESISPAHGPLRGGTALTIRGERFVDGCVVRIGDADVPVTFESAESLGVCTPERSTFGYVDVRVTNPDGASEARVHGFQYDVPPLPEFVKPDTLGPRGGTVRVFGEAFVEGVIVTIGGMPVPVVYKGEDCLELTIASANPGPLDIVITNPDGQAATLVGKLKIAEGPVIEGVSPTVGLPLGGTRVVITGRNFARGCTVTLFGTLAPQVTYDSDKRLLFTAPAHEAGVGAVRVTNPDGLSVAVENGFEYRSAPPPNLTSITPDRAWVTGGARLLVNGADFAESVFVTIGGKDAAAKWKNAGLLEVIVPPGAEPGEVTLVIANPDGQTVTAPFFYERVPTPPKLIAVTPNRGPTHGNVHVMFTGDNFDENTVVRIAEVRTTTRVSSKTEMEVLVPPRPKEGAVAVELVSAEGVTVRFEDVFYYNDQPPPRVTGCAPNQGPTSGNTRVSIEGEGFSQDTFVRIGRERPKSIVIKSPEVIEIVTPPCKTTGFVDIEVGTNQTGSTVAKNMFRFVALPTPVVESVAPNRGSTAGGTEMSINGKHFNADVIVTIGGKQVKFKVISPDLIECKTPPGADGQMVDVSVKNLDGKESVIRRAFAYDARYR